MESEIEQKFIAVYKPLVEEFINQIEGTNLQNLPEPCLPVRGDNYGNEQYSKIAFIGWETGHASGLDEFVKTAHENINDILFKNKEVFGEYLEIKDWVNNFHSGFGDFVFRFLSRFYGINDWPEFKKRNDGKNELDNILNSIVWGNKDSIERFSVTAKGKNCSEDDYKKVKQASLIFDHAKNILQALEPKIMIVLKQEEDNTWLTGKVGDYNKQDNISSCLDYYYVQSTDTHIFWTKHPRALASKIDNTIDEILRFLIQKNINFPGKIYYSILQKIEKHIKEIANELNLNFTISDLKVGQLYSGFYLFRKDWQYCVIGLEFDSSWAGDFSYGICRKDLTIDVPDDIKKEIDNRLGASDGKSDKWPWYKWFEYRSLNNETLTKIESGELKESIKAKVQELLQKLEGLQL